MLQQILLNNFILIDKLELDLFSNMTVITGETGAGKSILIDAIKLALGARLDTAVVKDPKNRCEISLVFDIEPNLSATTWLKGRDLYQEKECVIRRVITPEGKSRCYVNDNPVTLQIASELGELLINIQGQHEHHALLKPAAQRNLLDDYGNHHELCQKVSSIFKNWQALKEKLDNLVNSQQDKQSKKEFLSFQLQEFTKLNLRENEIESLNQEHKQLANADQLQASCQQALNCFTTHTQAGILDLLHQTIKLLEPFRSLYPNFVANIELLNSSQIQIQEVYNEIRHLADTVDGDPNRLNYIDNRLAEIHSLAKKHRVLPEQLLALQKELQDQFDALDNFSEKLDELEKEIKAQETEYFLQAKKLSQKRTAAGKELSKLVTENMNVLGLQGGEFKIELEHFAENQPRQFGLEQIEFKIRANPGQPLQSLSKTASGGELSRISLAIQVVIAERIQVPSLIFDEVDVGIGGKTAEIVGRLLRKLGARAQVICITHLAQVAAQGKQHLHVEKVVQQKKTQTQISYLTQAQQIDEVARMLGGIQITEHTRAHAQEMLASVE